MKYIILTFRGTSVHEGQIPDVILVVLIQQNSGEQGLIFKMDI